MNTAMSCLKYCEANWFVWTFWYK